MFNSAFNEFAKKPDLDLYPEDLRANIDAVNEWVRAWKGCRARPTVSCPATYNLPSMRQARASMAP